MLYMADFILSKDHNKSAKESAPKIMKTLITPMFESGDENLREAAKILEERAKIFDAEIQPNLTESTEEEPVSEKPKKVEKSEFEKIFGEKPNK